MQKLRNALTAIIAITAAPLACHVATIRTARSVAEPVNIRQPTPTRTVAAPSESLLQLADVAVSDSARAAAAIDMLRTSERAGLDALFIQHADAVEKLRTDPTAARRDPKLLRLRHAIDRVAAQRDAHLSRLYWHTDLERAKAVARQTSRPILSLRLLGRLDEELSCANSRMFRTLLYPHAAVRQLLSEHFVLHWSSERPAPKIEIDMGDGRKLQSTITGNSVHYVLDATGAPIDAIPGLFGAAEFVRLVESARDAATRCRLASDAAACVRDWHAKRSTALRHRYDTARAELPDAIRSTLPASADELQISAPGDGVFQQLQAFDASVLALGKGSIEIKMLEGMRPVAQPRVASDVPWWERLLKVDASDFDENVRRAMVLKMSNTDPSGSTTASLAVTVAADSVRNSYVLHHRVHKMFQNEHAIAESWPTLNRRVYAELFLTAASDPWLGLRSDEVYDALEQPLAVVGD